MIQVFVNDKLYQYDKDISLAQLLQKLALKQSTGIAVAINQAVIPRDQWSDTLLQDQDKVMLITATQGG